MMRTLDSELLLELLNLKPVFLIVEISVLFEVSLAVHVKDFLTFSISVYNDLEMALASNVSFPTLMRYKSQLRNLSMGERVIGLELHSDDKSVGILNFNISADNGQRYV